MIVFLSCVKQKNNKPCAAKDMYRSALFIKSYKYAQTLNPRKIYILSAKYKVLELDDTIEPYNLTLNNMNKTQQKQWAYDCYKALQKKGVDFNEEVVFLCGENYRKYLSQCFKNVKCPIKNLGLGRQLAFYTKAIKG